MPSGIPKGKERVGLNQQGRRVLRDKRPEQSRMERQTPYEKEHYGGDPSHSADVEQLRTGAGLATGRVGPNVPHPPRLEKGGGLKKSIPHMLVEEGMASSGDVNPNQGRLFSHEEMGRVTQSEKETSQRTLVPPTPRSSGKGFLPGVGRTATDPYDTVAEARKAGDVKAAARIAQKKKGVISQQSREIGPTPLHPEEPNRSTPIRSTMDLLKRYHSPSREPRWYSGEAAGDVEHGAKVTGTSVPLFRRTVALGSAQMPWTSGHPQDATFYKNNVGFARQITEHIQKLSSRQFPPGQVAKSFRVPARSQGKEVPPDPKTGKQKTSQVQSLPIRTKIAAQHQAPEQTLGEQIVSASQKVPSFDVALAAGHGERGPQRRASQSVVLDTHMKKAAGIKKIYQNWIGSSTPGGYDVNAMALRRSGREVGKLPAPWQEHVWVGVRPETPPKQQMFKQNKKTGAESITPAARLPKKNQQK